MLKNKPAIILLAASAAAMFAWLGQFSARIVYNNTEGCAELPIIMYHSILKDPDRSGKYVVSPEQLRNDINYLYSAGYTTVSMAQVVDFVENNAPLPPKPVMLTFDDGSYNNFGYALPILKDLDAHAVFAIVGQYAEEFTQKDIANLSFGYMRWSDIKTLSEDSHAELANHSYSLHSTDGGRNGAKRKKGESAKEYIKIFTDDTQRLQKRLKEETGESPVIYCYPFGAYSKESFDTVKKLGFKASFSCTEGINILSHSSDCLYLLKRNNRASGMSSKEYFSKILKNQPEPTRK